MVIREHLLIVKQIRELGTDMTYEHFMIFARADPSPHQRKGQFLFNLLYIARRDLSGKLRCTGADPFHDDENIPAFYAFVQEHW